jgi:hypothetical protein
MAVMAKKQPQRKNLFQMQLHPELRKQLEKLKKRNLTTITAEINAAIRKHLADNGLWPPASSDKDA